MELGAFIGGQGNWIGAGPERMLKIAKLTLYLLGRKEMSRKGMQIVMGRWVFAMQFRRPFMSHFEAVWRCLNKESRKKQNAMRVKEELLLAICGMPLLHTWMETKVDEETTCSDASMTGGAVAVSAGLTTEGKAFVASQREEHQAQSIPVALISLFNGIGGASRSYDVAGVQRVS